MVAPGQRHWCGPGEGAAGAGFDARLDLRQFGVCGQGREPAVEGDKARGGLDGARHSIDGAQGNTIEHFGQSFGAGRMDAGSDAGDADGFLEEGGLLVLGLSESDGDFGTADRDGDAGEASSRAVVEEGGDARGKGLGAGNGLDEMALENSLGIADSGEIGARIPAKEEGEIVDKSFSLFTL